LTEYVAILEPGPKNWSAYVPDLPGCIATAKTRDEAESLIREAIEVHIAFLRSEGDEIPEPSSKAVRVAVEA
jgi:predicted RNase H-like HicB family nuclease